MPARRGPANCSVDFSGNDAMSFVNTPPHSHPQNSVEEINLGALLGELLDHYKLIAGITGLFTLIAVAYACIATPVYQANALVQIEQKKSNSLLSRINEILPDGQPQSAPEIMLLQSRMVLGKTVDKLALQSQIKPHYTPLVGKLMAKVMGEKPGMVRFSRLILPTDNNDVAEATLEVISKNHYRLTGEEFALEGKTGELLEKEGVSINVSEIEAEPGAKFTVTMVDRQKAISQLQENFSVAESGKDTGMLNLTLSGEDPQLIKTILNNIADDYLAQNIARQAAQDEKSLNFLSLELPRIRSDLDSAEDKLNAYRKQKDSVDLNMEAKSTLEQIVNVDNQLNELTFREADVAQLYKKDHPTYRALMEKRETLQNEKSKLNQRVSAMPSTQQEVLRLSRDVDSGRAVYLQLLSRQQELSVAKSSAIGNVRIIDDAITLQKPIKPKKAVIVLLGLMMGAALSVGLVLLKTVLRQGIESPEQLEERGLNVFACVPHSEWLRKNNNLSKKSASDVLLAVKNPADPAIEALRGLRTWLHFTMMEAKNNVLLISGISPGAGKTFISSNLAAVIAQTQKKVLLIDSDMRRGYQHALFHLEENPGLAEILKGQITFDKAVVSLSDAGLDCLPRGFIPSNPSELLMSAAFKTLLDTIAPRYDLIIIDTPPVMAVTDATVVGRYAGTVLIVAHSEENTPREAVASLRRFEQSGIAVKGWILNGVKKKASSYYSYGYSPYTSSYTNSYSKEQG
jgi:tyrosine-protein kinase Etk/Wzc